MRKKVIQSDKSFVLDDKKVHEGTMKPLTKPALKKSYSDKTGKPAGMFFK